MKTHGAAFVLFGASAALAAACTDASPPPLGDGTAMHAPSALPATGNREAGIDATDAHAPSLADGAADTNAYDASIFADGSGLAPLDDASSTASYPPDAAVRGGGGDSTVCLQALAWRVCGATLDASVVSVSVAVQLNPLLSVQHPLTLAALGSDAGALLQVSGTLANGISQQYFPYQYPAAPAPLVISAAGALPTFVSISPVAPPSMGWLHVVDGAGSDVWIPLSNVSTSATAGDALCGSLMGGEVDAVIPSSAASTTLVLGGATTTISQLFGHETSTFPPGWSMRLLFPTATSVQVTFK